MASEPLSTRDTEATDTCARSATSRIVAALAAGNRVLIKPSELTPLSSVHFVKVLEEAGVPPGVVNLITGGPHVGELLTTHPDVSVVSFTGSTRAGKRVMQVFKPERDDVIVFVYPEDRTKDFIKRVVGIEGDTIEVRDKRLRYLGDHVDDVVLEALHTRRVLLGAGWSLAELAAATRMTI